MDEHRLPPGAGVRVEMSKWGERPHWEFAGLYLGADALGDWIGVPAGTRHARPGLAFDSDVDTVTLAPRDGWWLATLHRPGIWCDVYVDIATMPVWDGPVVRSVDLDLDVVRRSSDGLVYVDDEDEFAEHQRTLGYPPDVVDLARRSCAQVLDDVQAARAPYDRSGEEWFDRLDALARA